LQDSESSGGEGSEYENSHEERHFKRRPARRSTSNDRRQGFKRSRSRSNGGTRRSRRAAAGGAPANLEPGEYYDPLNPASQPISRVNSIN